MNASEVREKILNRIRVEVVASKLETCDLCGDNAVPIRVIVLTGTQFLCPKCAGTQPQPQQKGPP